MNKQAMQRLKRITFAVSTILYAGSVFADATSYQVNIPAQRLDLAVQSLSKQSGAQILFVTDNVSSQQSRHLQGHLTVEQALSELLKGTHLHIKSIGENKFTIVEGKEPARNLGQLNSIDVNATQSSVASDNQNIAQLPVITVSATDETRTEGNNSYTTRKATTGKFEQSLREIPQSISVMTRKQLDDQNISNLKEAMVQATGVTVTSNGAYAQTGYQMRGYTALQQQDGLSVGSNDSYTIAPPRDMEIYDRVEVLRGPVGLLEGSGDPSGVINMVRRRPSAEAEGFVNLSYGSWNNKRVSVGAGNALNEAKSVRGRMILTHQEREFFYDHAEENRSSIYAMIEADLTDKTLATASINYSQSDSIPFYGWPANGGGISRETYLGATWNKTKIPQHFESFVDLTHEFDNGWKVKAATVYQKGELDAQMGLATLPNLATGLTSYYGYRQRSDNELIGTELSLSGDFDLFGRTHEFILGGNWNQSVTNVGGTSNYDNPNAPSYWGSDFLINPRIRVEDIPDPDRIKTETETTKSGYYGAVKYKILDSLTFVLGGRFSNYDLKSRGTGLDNSSGWETSDGKADMEFTPYGGLVWDFSNNLSWYASYTDIFSPQTEKDWQGKVLDPRIGWQIETGIKGEFFDQRLNTALSVYRIQDKNRATTDLNPAHYPNTHCNGDGLATFSCSYAGGTQQTQGIELEVVGKVTDQWNIISSYVYTNAEVLKSNSSNTWDYKVGQNFSPRTPEHAFKLWTTYDFSDDRFSVGGGLNAQSKLEDKPNNLRNPGFAVFSAQGSYKVNPDVSVAFNVNNIFDTQYFAGMGYAVNRWMYGEPRNYMLTLRAKY